MPPTDLETMEDEMTKQMTVRQATAAAREFVECVTRRDRRWTIGTVECFVPEGWSLSPMAGESDFHPVTIKHVAHAYRAACRPE